MSPVEYAGVKRFEPILQCVSRYTATRLILGV